jgi:hypothetical protein
MSAVRAIALGENVEVRRSLMQADTQLKSALEYANARSERRLEMLFYLLVTKLQLFTIETPEMSRLYDEFIDELRAQIHSSESNTSHTVPTIVHWWEKIILFRNVRWLVSTINNRLNLLQDRIRINQMRAFLYMCESYIHTLEWFYKAKSLSSRILDLYVLRMDIKKDRYLYNREYGLFTGFSLFRSISSYGTSFSRLAVTCTLSVVLFGSIYWLADFFAPADVRMIASLTDYSSYFFNSLVTISGLGIDASPQTALQRVAMGINTIYGMIVFGMLFNVISTKLSMNN